jgi:hypothetical protein
MTPLGILTLIVGAGALLSLAAFTWWLWFALPPDPLGADAERRYQASERHVRGRGR